MPYYVAWQEKVAVLGDCKGNYCFLLVLYVSSDFKNNVLFLILNCK